MQTIRVVIVDDEKPARERVRRMLTDYREFKVVGEAGDVEAAADLIDRARPDLCFLDVKMPGGDGFDVLARITHLPRVIFVTAYDDFAVRAFEVNSLDYLLKPFTKKRFAAALDRVREARVEETPGSAIEALLERIRAGLPVAEALGSDPGSSAAPGDVDRIPARKGSRIVLLDPGEILCFEAEETLVFARTADSRFMIERTLTDLENRLGAKFFRTHRSYLVNLAQVSEILPDEAGTYRVVLRGEARTEVPLSRRQARRLREKIPW
ncbi:MAG: LytTR family DNA-binding domain-containing protein [Acidobacteriota bacterium]|nr:LytTR family DNA-binding domain-containing protein [Acidobacteriota bacterium]